MAFDDDDDARIEPTATATLTADQALETADEDLEDEAQDFRHFLFLQRKQVSSQAIRKGEKDYENFGIQSQASALEASRSAMEDVLGYTRLHNPDGWLRAWYFPERWAAAGEEGEAYLADCARLGKEVDEKQAKIAREKAAERRETHARDRVVCARLNHHTVGRNVRGQGELVPGWDQVWLLPEEALFLIERGSMDLWWPTATLEEIFPVKSADDPDDGEALAQRMKALEELEEEDEYALGVPLSLQAAYSLLVGNEGERGKTTLRNLQVFSNLNRAGFHLFRAPPPDSVPHTNTTVANCTPSTQQPIWQRLISLLFPDRPPIQPSYGPLVQPGLYRSYAAIYQQLAVLPRHKPLPHTPSHPSTTASSPFRIQYHAWKPATLAWSKTKPPSAPDYHLAIVDARETGVPTCEEISDLLATVPSAPPPAKGQRGGYSVHQRLKHGHRNVLVAVVDHGLVNFMRFAEGAYGEEELFGHFDGATRSRGGKQGGRGGRGGGRGRGRGRGGRG